MGTENCIPTITNSYAYKVLASRSSNCDCHSKRSANFCIPGNPIPSNLEAIRMQAMTMGTRNFVFNLSVYFFLHSFTRYLSNMATDKN